MLLLLYTVLLFLTYFVIMSCEIYPISYLDYKHRGLIIVGEMASFVVILARRAAVETISPSTRLAG